jgi:hypothetical protein
VCVIFSAFQCVCVRVHDINCGLAATNTHKHSNKSVCVAVECLLVRMHDSHCGSLRHTHKHTQTLEQKCVCGC